MSNNSTAQNIGLKPYASKTGKKALEDHFSRRDIMGTIEYIPEFAIYNQSYHIRDPKPQVEIICSIKHENLSDYLKLLHSNIKYENYHVTVINNCKYCDPTTSSSEQRIIFPNTSVLPKLNLKNITNNIIQNSNADYICLITECVVGFSERWLSKMVEQAIQDRVGAVGPKLIDSNNLIFSNGIILNPEGTVEHLFQKKYYLNPGYLYWAMIQRGYSALSGEGLLFSKKIFEEINGFNPNIKSKFLRHIDFCLKLRSHNYRNILIPSIILKVNEKRFNERTTNQQSTKEINENSLLLKKWEHWFREDPAFNKNLLIENGGVTINLSPEYNHWTKSIKEMAQNKYAFW
jgi:hypothetical protein